MRRINLKAYIHECGGALAFAEAQGVSVQAVYGWIKANSLPLQRAHDLAEAHGIGRDLFHDPWAGTRMRSEMMSAEETRALFEG